MAKYTKKLKTALGKADVEPVLTLVNPLSQSVKAEVTKHPAELTSRDLIEFWQATQGMKLIQKLFASYLRKLADESQVENPETSKLREQVINDLNLKGVTSSSVIEDLRGDSSLLKSYLEDMDVNEVINETQTTALQLKANPQKLPERPKAGLRSGPAIAKRAPEKIEDVLKIVKALSIEEILVLDDSFKSRVNKFIKSDQDVFTFIKELKVEQVKPFIKMLGKDTDFRKELYSSGALLNLLDDFRAAEFLESTEADKLTENSEAFGKLMEALSDSKRGILLKLVKPRLDRLSTDPILNGDVVCVALSALPDNEKQKLLARVVTRLLGVAEDDRFGFLAFLLQPKASPSAKSIITFILHRRGLLSPENLMLILPASKESLARELATVLSRLYRSNPQLITHENFKLLASNPGQAESLLVAQGASPSTFNNVRLFDKPLPRIKVTPVDVVEDKSEKEVTSSGRKRSRDSR